jgi:transcriptional regulator with XRE-family HTH domain
MIGVMPRKNPLPDLEAEICRRLLEFRKVSGLSRAALAKRAGCNSAMISSLEHLRSPLRYWTGKEICNGLRLNPDWLVKGLGYPIWDGQLASSFEGTPSKKALFSEVYLKNFPESGVRSAAQRRAWIEEINEWCQRMGLEADFKSASPKKEEELERRLLSRPVMRLILEDRDRMIIQEAFGREIQSAFAPESPPGKEVIFEARNLSLENVTDPVTMRKVLSTPSQNKLRRLLDRVQRLTAARGSKAALAKTLGVPKQRVTGWLNGASAPNAETTLQLLEWATVEEAKQKNAPERALTRPGRAAHQRKSTNEKPKPGQRKASGKTPP